jgi:major vault protein
VLNKNNNVNKLIIGPKTYIREENEVVKTGDEALEMIIIPPNNYCEINNPVVMKDG